MKHFTLLIILLVFGNPLLAQNEQTFKDIQFVTKDKLTISGIMQYPTTDKKENFPVVILIHQGRSSTKEWAESSILNKLLENGFAILAYDIRLHGKSGKDGEFGDLYNNPERAPLDLLAAIAYLEQDKQIDASSIGILGASIGANLASMAAASEKYNIKSAVAMSAKTQAAQNLSGNQEKLSPKNVFYIASKEEQDGKRMAWANELFTLTSGMKKVEIAEGNKHGSFILGEHSYLESEIIAWFNMSLKE